jgi:Tfp pilus assembly protein PilV
MTTAQARDERGETLAEVLVTMAILAIAVVVLVGALADTIVASSSHRQHTTGDTIARDVSEALKNRNTAFQANGSYPGSFGVAVPSGFTVNVAATCWNGNSPATFSASANCTTGLQQLVVTVTSTAKGEQEAVTILKRAS